MSAIHSAASKKPLKTDVRKLTTMAMLAAIGIVLMLVCKFSIIPSASFLKYDPAEVPILVGSLIYGPGAGLILTLLVSFVDSFVLSGSGGPIGFVMHMVSTGAMAMLAGFLYKKGANIHRRAAASLAAGAVVKVCLMIVMNLLLTPIYTGLPREQIAQMLLPVFIPFNVIKASLNCVFTFLVYKYVEKLVVHSK